MKRGGRPRREVLAALCPRDAGVIVDVGADHGHVAEAVGAIATERAPHRCGRAAVPWVVADGLRPFRHVDVAIIAGMGAHTIAGILEAGPLPRVAVLHAPDDPQALRRYLARAGWRIDAERLAPEAGRFAEVVRVVRGLETARGLTLALGPRLLEGDDPHLVAHLDQLLGHWRGLANATRGRDPRKHRQALRLVTFLAAHRVRRGLGPVAPPASDAEDEAS